MKQQNFEDLIDAAKKNRKGLVRLKTAAVILGQYELAAELRALELKQFPDTKEVKKAKSNAREIEILFHLIDLKVPEHTCWLINESIKLYNKKKGAFTMKDAAKLRAKEHEIYKIDFE